MTSDSPLVSVIIPVYNSEKYVEESVRSVMNQTYKNIEIICFNDASTDNSLSVLRRLEDEDNRLVVIDSLVNLKQGGGRNRGLSVARGEYVMFLDSDDALEPDAVKECVEAASARDSDAVFFDWSLYYPTKGLIKPVCQLGEDAEKLEGDNLRQRIIERSTAIWSAMYRKSLIVDNALYFPEGVFYEDNAVALALQLAASNPVKLNRSFYLYRQDNLSVTRTSDDDRFFHRIGSAVMLLENLKRVGVYERFKDRLDYVFFRQYLEHTVYGAIYRFSTPRIERIKEVRDGIGGYIGNFRKNPYYRRRPLAAKLKIETHLRFPRLIKHLSNLRRRMRS